MLKKLFFILLEITAILVAGALAAALALAWRLTKGPVEVTFLTPQIAAGLSELLPGYQVAVGATQLRWLEGEGALDLKARQVTLTPRDGAPTLVLLPEVGIGFSLPALLSGQFRPTALELARPELHLTRKEDGQLDLALEGAGEGGGALAGEFLAGLTAAPGGRGMLAEFTRLNVQKARLKLEDRRTGQVWLAPNAQITLTRNQAGLLGQVAVELEAGGRHARMTATLTYDRRARVLELKAHHDGLAPSVLATADPILAPLATLDLPFSGLVSARFGPDFRLERLRLDTHGGAGQLNLDRLYPAPIALKGAELRAELDAATKHLKLDRLELALADGPALTLAGDVAPGAGGMALKAEAELTGTGADQLDFYWPEGLAPGARAWVTRNISGGQVGKATARLTATTPADDLLDVHVTGLAGTLSYDGLEVDYFHPLPPATGVRGTARFDSETFDLDIAGGQVTDLAITGGTIKIDDLGGDHEHPSHIDIRLSLEGPFRSALRIINQKPLGYPDKLGLPVEGVEGEAVVDAEFRFPLLKDVKLDQLDILTRARLKGVELQKLFGDRTLSGGGLELTVDQHHMDVSGAGRLDGIPARFSWTENFGAHVKTRSEVRAALSLDAAARARLGIGFNDNLTGAVPVDLTWRTTPDGKGRLEATADFAPVRLLIPELGVDKPPGEPGAGTAMLELTGRKLQRISAFTLDAAGLAAAGRLDFGGDGAVEELHLDRLTHGVTDVTVDAKRTAEAGLSVTLTGKGLDLAPLMRARKAAPAAPPAEGEEPPLEVALAVDRLQVVEGAPALGRVEGQLARRGHRWVRVRLAGQAGEGTFSVLLVPVGAGQALNAETSDAGAALAAFGVTSKLRGGRLGVGGSAPDWSSPLAGHMEATNFRVVDAPGLARLLNALSAPGLIDLFNLEGMYFNKLAADFSYGADTLTLTEGRANGSALGMTFEGVYEMVPDAINLQGEIVPIYGLNQVIGSIPLLGDVLTGGEGRGVIASTWRIRGPAADPEVSVNPLSVFAPGFLRSLFFEGDMPTAPTPPPKPPEPPPVATPAEGEGGE